MNMRTRTSFAILSGILIAAFGSFQAAVGDDKLFIRAIQASPDFKHADAKLNQVYGQLAKVLDQTGRSALLKEQQTWIETRDGQCQFLTSSSLEDYADCLAAATRRRTAVLEQKLKAVTKPGPKSFTGEFVDHYLTTLTLQQTGNTVTGTYSVLQWPPAMRVEQASFSGRLVNDTVTFNWGPTNWGHAGTGTIRWAGNDIDIRTVVTQRDSHAMWSFPNGDWVRLYRSK